MPKTSSIIVCLNSCQRVTLAATSASIDKNGLLSLKRGGKLIAQFCHPHWVSWSFDDEEVKNA